MKRLVSFLPPQEGGLGIPDITLYYHTAQLRYLVKWSRAESEKHWVFQDQAVAGMPLRNIPFILKPHSPPNLYASQVTSTMLNIWDRTNTRHALTTFPSPLTSFLDNPDFSPGFGRQAFQRWREAGCHALGFLFDKGDIIPFSRLRTDYGLPESERLRYLQIRHWAMHPENRTQTIRPLTQYERWLITRSSDKKLISDLYKLRLSRYTHTFHAGWSRWERDLGRDLIPKEWEGACYRARHTAAHRGLTETLAKIVYYWYYTPERLHQATVTQSPDCWRGCGKKGTLLHLLWDCEHLQTYWTHILDEVDKHLDTELPRLPEYTLLGVPNPLTYPLRFRRGKQIAIALGTAIQNILIHWRTPHTPAHTGWYQRLWHVLGMENISLTLAGRGSSFSKLWQPFLSLLAPEFRELHCPRCLRLLHLTTPDPTP